MCLLCAGDILLTDGIKTGESRVLGITTLTSSLGCASRLWGGAALLPHCPGMLSASLFCVWSEATGSEL